MNNTFRLFLATLLAVLCGLALTGCPDGGDTSWRIDIHGDANPGTGSPGGFTGTIHWRF